MKNRSILTDRFGRIHNYLRISITGGFNFGCSYCNPSELPCSNYTAKMSATEIGQIANSFFSLGINKIRITGGEPLIRKDFSEIANKLANIPIRLALTTNGALLGKYLGILKESNINNINISLDSLVPHKFNRITGQDSFNLVYGNIFKALNAGFNVKLNTVINKGVNESEIIEFAKLTLNYPITIRFIEFMPFKDNNWSSDKTFDLKSIVGILEKEFDINSLNNAESDTSTNFKIKNSEGQIGIISTISKPFCSSCNRIRITSDGMLKSCLFGNSEVDLLLSIRKGQNISQIIDSVLKSKPHKHRDSIPFSANTNKKTTNRNMFLIGG